MLSNYFSAKETSPIKKNIYDNSCLFFIGLYIVCRMVAMVVIPLNDSTEARYAEIARKMLETGNWIVLQHDYGVPFWAKPPLSTWLSAISMKLFGIHAFAARLPSLILSIACVWMVGSVALQSMNRTSSQFAMLVLMGSIYFLLDAGAVMTDPALLFSITLMMVAFWKVIVATNTPPQYLLFWRYALFVGAGLGLLAKGPIAVIFSGASIFIWVALHHEWRKVWQNLPWGKGIMLSLAIALPWYIAIEQQTPGFLRYFLIGEHIERFLKPAWQGDKYGLAHTAPFGMIWIYMIVGMLPWVVFLPNWLFKHRCAWKMTYAKHKPSMQYFLLFMCIPLLLFTFSGNMIYTYVFPCIPAFSLLFVYWLNEIELTPSLKRWLAQIAIIPAIVFVVTCVLFSFFPQLITKSQESVVEAWNVINRSSPAATTQSPLVYWQGRVDYSAQFYSAGQALATMDRDRLANIVRSHHTCYVAISEQMAKLLPESIVSCTQPLKQFNRHGITWTLARIQSSCYPGL